MGLALYSFFMGLFKAVLNNCINGLERKRNRVAQDKEREVDWGDDEEYSSGTVRAMKTTKRVR